MLKFNKVLLASDFDNTLVYTQGALERGEDIPPMSARNREAREDRGGQGLPRGGPADHQAAL